MERAAGRPGAGWPQKRAQPLSHPPPPPLRGDRGAHGSVLTFAEAPCEDHVTDGFLAATQPSLRAPVPAPRAPALRLRRRLSLAARPRHDVTPSKGLKLQLATGRSGVGVGVGWEWEESLSAEQSSGAALRRLLICLARVCGCCSNQPLSLGTVCLKMVSQPVFGFCLSGLTQLL